jgi:hypothetical protein
MLLTALKTQAKAFQSSVANALTKRMKKQDTKTERGIISSELPKDSSTRHDGCSTRYGVWIIRRQRKWYCDIEEAIVKKLRKSFWRIER